MTTRYILLGGQLIDPYANTDIDPYANNYVSVLATDPDFAINSTFTAATPQMLKGVAEPTFTNINIVPAPTVNPAITVTMQTTQSFGTPYFIMETLDPFPGITSTTTVPTDSIVNYMRFINLSLDVISDVRNYPITPLQDAEVGDTSHYSIKSTQSYGNFVWVPGISFTIPSALTFGANTNLARGFAPGTTPSTLVFGTIKLDMEIDDPDSLVPQLMPIESTLTLGEFRVGKALSPTSINSSVSYGLPSFGDFIHRTLIFKNDNLGKIGPQDSVEIVNGLVFNPLIETSNTQAVNEPVGAISVTVSGTDYKLPFYNQIPTSSSDNTLTLAPYITVVNASARFASKSYAASNTYVQKYLEVANSSSFITSSSLTPYISVSNANAKFATKSYAASNTYVKRYLEVANSTGFITIDSLAPYVYVRLQQYMSVVNANAKFASNTYVNTQLNKYLQVANSNVTNWNTAYSWGNHASAGYPVNTVNAYVELNNVGIATLRSSDNVVIQANDKGWTFAQNGRLTFPDTTYQTTAWSDSKLTPYISVANTNAKFATKAYAASNTFVNTQLSKYLQVANSSVSNWNTAYGWGNHASAGYLTSVSWSQVTGKPQNIVTLSDTNVITNSMLVSNSITIGSTAVALGSSITTLTGLTGVTSNAATAFIAGTAAESGVALQMPREGALRNLTNGDNSMYFDVSIGGSTHGSFQFRSSSSFTNVLTMSPTAFNVNPNAVVTARTPSFGRLPWNSAIDTELSIDDYRFRISNQGGIFPQVISNTGGSKNSAWTVVAARSGSAINQTGSTGTLVPNNSWTSLYTSGGMDSAGDTYTVTLQDKAQGRIYRITFMRSDNGSTTGYNIIAERLL